MDPEEKIELSLTKSEFAKKYTRSSGNGGQRINKVSTCVQITHIPTGIQVKCQDTRDQKKNEEIAWKRISDKLTEIENLKYQERTYKNRFNQTASSGRSDKRRTYRIKENLVIDHVTNKTASFSQIQRGNINLLSKENPS